MQLMMRKPKCPKRTKQVKKKSGKRLQKKRYLELLRLEGQKGFKNLKIKYINSKNMNIIKEKYRNKERVNYVTVIFVRKNKDKGKMNKKIIYNTVKNDSKQKKLMKVINQLHIAPTKFKDYVDTKKVAYSVLNYFTGGH